MEQTELTPRQKHILTDLVKEYIVTGKAVSSLRLESKYKLPVSSATVRNDFLVLTEKGYLYKEYASSGRVPTNKTWRWFVQSILEKNTELPSLPLPLYNIFLKYRRQIGEQNQAVMIKDLLNRLVEENHFFGFGYLSQEDRLYEDGLEYIFRDIAQEGIMSLEAIQPLVQSVNNLEENLKDITIPQNLAVFIGKDNPLIPSDEFSAIIASLPSCSAFVGVIGTKRMPYGKHIALLREISNMFSNEDNSNDN